MIVTESMRTSEIKPLRVGRMQAATLPTNVKGTLSYRLGNYVNLPTLSQFTKRRQLPVEAHVLVLCDVLATRSQKVLGVPLVHSAQPNPAK